MNVYKFSNLGNFERQTKLWKREYGNCFRTNASLLLGIDESSSLALGKLSAPNNHAYTLQNYYEDANRRSTTVERMKKIYIRKKSIQLSQKQQNAAENKIKKEEEEYLQTNGIVFGSVQGIAKGTPTAAAIYVFAVHVVCCVSIGMWLCCHEGRKKLLNTHRWQA